MKQFQHLDAHNKTWTLFGGKSLNIADVNANLALPDISQVLSATTNVDTEIANFVNNVRKNQNPFLIQNSKLYTNPNDTQREVAIRIVLYLYRIYHLADKEKLDDAQVANFEDIIDNQLKNREIPKFKGIYNVKKELEYVQPEYELIADMNTKLGDINQPNL